MTIEHEPVPIRRYAVGCLLIAVLVVAVILLVRPVIFSLAPPRDDSAVIVATAAEAAAGPVRRDVVLARSYGHHGELAAGDGRVQLRLLIGPGPAGGVVVLNAASPAADDCAVEIDDDRLTDCDGRAWTLEGIPLDSGDPPLQRFAATVEDGAVVADLTMAIDD
ncbi:MAG TPA: hypothetical protein VHQ42_06025 [Candidatus Limnocylindria bacterium]|nr:hypothetical protein [Candidatus Limnocylindria bacterium]